MRREEIKEILQSSYSLEKWYKMLEFLSGTKNLLTLSLEPKAVEIKSAKAKEIVIEVVQLGTLKTTDGITLPIFDVTLQNDINIEYNRVGVNDLLKTHILKDAIKGAIVTFHYNVIASEAKQSQVTSKTEWRFSFISKFGSDYFAEVESIETNPKKYTYIFGTPEEHRTAIERLYNLEQSRFRLEDFFEAFNVEPVSNTFFKEYKNFYLDFVEELSKKESANRAIFEQEKSEDIDKDIRNFVKRLLGRLVFLYFLQKKNWLGATNKNYDDGDTNFLYNLFNYNNDSKDHFYSKWLSKLFFNALNTPNRKNDSFELPNGNSVWIPFLNGGLFEEHQEPQKHREIQFPPTLFELLFKFFNGYNFTIYENSPEDHTVAVDPEMLGHIFENLLEDNKDKGAFYTPKEIVHYMTQESLIEYLKTHLSHSREAIENLIKNHATSNFTRDDLKEVEKLIDRVKICDPAIGSGAFPMGLLQEIFGLKAVIHYELGYNVWSPAKIKQDIIQNSIYGVDLEEGAVDIARLRFWLSLVVDEPTPKPLPNLDYKIMQGNSLLESYDGIDLSNLATADEQVIDEQVTFNFGDDFNTKVTLFDAVSMEQFQILMDKYFSPEEWEKKTKEKVDKIAIKKQINNVIEGKIHAKIYKEKEDIENKIKNFESKFNIKTESDFAKLNTKAKEFKTYEVLKNRYNEIENIEAELIEFQKTDERPYFLWRLYFADVFKNGGFDIVIANPPYVGVKGNGKTFELIKNSELSKYFKGRAELFYFFMHKAIQLGKHNCINTFITTNYFITATDANLLRTNLKEETTILNLLNFNELKLFASAMGQHNLISIFKKGIDKNVKAKTFFTRNKGFANSNELERIFSFKDTNTDYFELYQDEIFEDKENYIRIGGVSGGNDELSSIFKALKTDNLLGDICYVRQGLRTGIDKITETHIKKFKYKGDKGEGVFILSEDELNKKGILKTSNIVKPLFKNSDVNKYLTNESTNQYLLYIDKNITIDNLLNENINIYNHLLPYKELIQKIRFGNNEDGNDWFRLDRTREQWLFEGEKIVAPQRSKSNKFGYNNISWYSSADVYYIKKRDEKFNLKYILALLNSKLFFLWLSHKGKRKGDMLELYQKPLSEIPIIFTSKMGLFESLIDMLFFSKSNVQINDTVKNDHISNFFEEVIDGCVFELYFEEHMKEKGINIIDDVKSAIVKSGLANDFENLDEEVKKQKIWELYKEMSTGTVQVKMTDFITKSPDILKPILQS
ncbi:Eco57I restriction-modification methylase domain-containing protein [Flavobacterium covae]|uniref:Eco57I restriction-modification methylase domain-containing protein n=1 Tax=Flavobacterium covae TaxID=2906076 RepID=UPI001FB79115|nr:TaqI-like C-terminal specificity domain-containing protein [Flavobacterium covae]MCJ1805729.1 Eco57I restriction-modification methylase domain-containing protein [Flavobacterium covae]